jgi:hypothetical protein
MRRILTDLAKVYEGHTPAPKTQHVRICLSRLHHQNENAVTRLGLAQFYDGGRQLRRVLPKCGRAVPCHHLRRHVGLPQQELHAHDTNAVSFAQFHLNLLIITSGSEDGTTEMWNSDTYR